MSKLVLDISKYDPVNNYKSVVNSVDGVLVRCGYRAYRNGALMKDPLFEKHMNNLVSNGAKVGVYFFSTAINNSEGSQEADYVYKLIKNYPISFPVFVDSEYSNSAHNGRSDNISKTVRTNALIGFCERIKELGYTPGIYFGDFWVDEGAIDLSKLSKYKLWIARYGKKPTRVKNYIAWQYTETGKVSGISGKVDLSYWYEDFTSTRNNTIITPSAQINKKNSSNDDNPYNEPDDLLRRGDRGDSVKWVQYELNKRNYGLDVDGIYGADTYSAVKEFQIKHNLEVDGITGNEVVSTLKSLNNSAKIDTNKEVSNSNINDLSTGTRITLGTVNLYNSSDGTKIVRKISGIYYIWNDKIMNGKIRITKIKNSNDADDVVGWIDVSDIK